MAKRRKEGSEGGEEDQEAEEEALGLNATSRSSHLNVSKIASYGPVCAME